MKLMTRLTFAVFILTFLSCTKSENKSPALKIAIAGLAIESSTFSPALTHEEAFHAKTGKAILDNYPFYIFDTLVTADKGANSYYKCNIKTLGIKLETDSSTAEIAPKSIRKTSDFMMSFSLLSSEYLNRRHLGSQQKAQTIFINTHNFNPKIKRQKKAVKLEVMQYGREAVLEFFVPL